MTTWYWIDEDHRTYPLAPGEYPGKNEANRHLWRVGLDEVDNYRVSTVFLCLDHNFSKTGPPIMFETMIFLKDSWSEVYCKRYASWGAADLGHKLVVQKLESGVLP